jgi:uncharacterized membrane protein
VNVGYIVLGVVLIVFGGVQVYLRHFAGIDDEDRPGNQVRTRQGSAGGRVWRGWTAILGVVCMAFGVVFVVLGVLGRG